MPARTLVLSRVASRSRGSGCSCPERREPPGDRLIVQYPAVMILETRAVPPFFKNGFVVGCEETREGIVIDPGDEVDELLELVDPAQLSIKYILLTHAHLDHITGVGRAKAALGAPVGLHQDDNFLYERIVQQGLTFGFRGGEAAGRRFLLRGGRPAALRAL